MKKGPPEQLTLLERLKAARAKYVYQKATAKALQASQENQKKALMASLLAAFRELEHLPLDTEQGWKKGMTLKDLLNVYKLPTVLLLKTPSIHDFVVWEYFRAEAVVDRGLVRLNVRVNDQDTDANDLPRAIGRMIDAIACHIAAIKDE